METQHQHIVLYVVDSAAKPLESKLALGSILRMLGAWRSLGCNFETLIGTTGVAQSILDLASRRGTDSVEMGMVLKGLGTRFQMSDLPRLIRLDLFYKDVAVLYRAAVSCSLPLQLAVAIIITTLFADCFTQSVGQHRPTWRTKTGLVKRINHASKLPR
jgi:hypothetical protein